MDEFELIRRYFTRVTADPDVRIGVGDDGAVLRPAAARDLVTVVDTMVEGIHYPPDLPADDIGFRAVAVNLSDIAAMAGRARWMTLALTLREADAAWLERFAEGLFAAADEYSVSLVGGDTTHGSQTVISVQITGDVDPDAVLTRAGATPGDLLFVSGTPGEAAAGLDLIRAGAVDSEAARHLAMRFRRPAARIPLGERIARLASAAIDVSDGLYGDAAKLLGASGAGGRIDLERLPVSAPLAALADPAAARRYVLSGGDDYELCFAAPPGNAAAIEAAGRELGIRITRIGEVLPGDRLVCAENGTPVDYRDSGYLHFGASAT